MNKDLRNIAVRDVELAVNRSGEGARLLSLHGAKDFHAWHPVHDMLAERFDVIAPVHPGFGGSARASDIETVDDLAYLYLDLIHDAGWAPVHLMGAGLGGWIAAEMAVRESAKLASMILVDAVGIKVSKPETPDIVDVSTMAEEKRNAGSSRQPPAAVLRAMRLWQYSDDDALRTHVVGAGQAIDAPPRGRGDAASRTSGRGESRRRMNREIDR